MTLQESEKHQRLIRPEDDDEDYFSDRQPERDFEVRRPAPPTKFVFHLEGPGYQKAPEVKTTYIRFKDVIETSYGPCKVVEIFWSGCEHRGWRADVLLKPTGGARHTKKKLKGGYDKSKQPYKMEKRPWVPGAK